MQIKGEESLADLSKLIKFITDTFDEYEKELDENNIKELNEKVSALTWKIKGSWRKHCSARAMFSSKLITHPQRGKEEQLIIHIKL